MRPLRVKSANAVTMPGRHCHSLAGNGPVFLSQSWSAWAIFRGPENAVKAQTSTTETGTWPPSTTEAQLTSEASFRANPWLSAHFACLEMA
jgi:hypothetical protein